MFRFIAFNSSYRCSESAYSHDHDNEKRVIKSKQKISCENKKDFLCAFL